MDSAAASIAPDWHVAQWFNAASPLTLQDLRGKVVVLHAFQMLCPGCVTISIPQAQRIARAFDPAHLAVIGIHTEFEHHDVMTPQALAVFFREFQLSRSEEHTSELQSPMRISYAVFCLKKKNKTN